MAIRTNLLVFLIFTFSSVTQVMAQSAPTCASLFGTQIDPYSSPAALLSHLEAQEISSITPAKLLASIQALVPVKLENSTADTHANFEKYVPLGAYFVKWIKVHGPNLSPIDFSYIVTAIAAKGQFYYSSYANSSSSHSINFQYSSISEALQIYMPVKMSRLSVSDAVVISNVLSTEKVSNYHYPANYPDLQKVFLAEFFKARDVGFAGFKYLVDNLSMNKDALVTLYLDTLKISSFESLEGLGRMIDSPVISGRVLKLQQDRFIADNKDTNGSMLTSTELDQKINELASLFNDSKNPSLLTALKTQFVTTWGAQLTAAQLKQVMQVGTGIPDYQRYEINVEVLVIYLDKQKINDVTPEFFVAALDALGPIDRRSNGVSHRLEKFSKIGPFFVKWVETHRADLQVREFASIFSKLAIEARYTYSSSSTSFPNIPALRKNENFLKESLLKAQSLFLELRMLQLLPIEVAILGNAFNTEYLNVWNNEINMRDIFFQDYFGRYFLLSEQLEVIYNNIADEPGERTNKEAVMKIYLASSNGNTLSHLNYLAQRIDSPTLRRRIAELRP